MTAPLPLPDFTVTNPPALYDRAEAEAYVASICFKHGPPTRLGAELEWVVQHSGNPHRPLDPTRLAALLGPHAPPTLRPGSPHLPLPHGSAVTAEPGGQLEISSPPFLSLPELVTAVDADITALTELVRPAGLYLADCAADPLRQPRRILDVDRYAAMEAAFDRVGPMGRVMMCSTAAVQICLDAGTPRQVSARWAALHELGPVLLAAFANSPRLDGRLTGWVSSRMYAWFALDPVRTGPRPVHPDPAADWARRALDTSLLCRRHVGKCRPVPDGVTFADWLAGALPGTPTTDDLDYHLTTLFPPVRPHGHLEVRYLDTQPHGQWAVPVAVVAALLAVPATIDAARDACSPAVGRWFTAARDGLRDPVLATTAATVFDLACRALDVVRCPQPLRSLIEDITERRVACARCPADDEIDRCVEGGTG